MTAKTVQFSFRLSKALHDRLIDVVKATDNEVTRSGLCELALEPFLAQLAVNPGMVTNYQPELDKSARRLKQAHGGRKQRKTSDMNERQE